MKPSLSAILATETGQEPEDDDLVEEFHTDPDLEALKAELAKETNETE